MAVTRIVGPEIPNMPVGKVAFLPVKLRMGWCPKRQAGCHVSSDTKF